MVSAWAIDDMCVAEGPAEPNFVTADPNNAMGRIHGSIRPKC